MAFENISKGIFAIVVGVFVPAAAVHGFVLAIIFTSKA